MSEEQRAAFEAHIRKDEHFYFRWLDRIEGESDYCAGDIQRQWVTWQAALSAKSVPEADEATTELRVVYEAARKFLRYNGVDKDKVNQALDELDEAIEAVKHIDGGYKDFPLEAAPPLPTDDERVRELEKEIARLDFVLKESAFIMKSDTDTKQTVYQLWAQDEDEYFWSLCGNTFHKTPRLAIDCAMQTPEEARTKVEF